ncbi:hypothetical protein GOP47_0008472 [Adiantum capillus-veneris]|uniref:Ribosome-recycling factor, chloroplastic n=1 Tax=Adiantum capillus-veneris TaxID=13818 RepID=A0A9D4UZV0_ADICA|nr:hypothetical protein GOP47_0008472 [Adiantum capillus-veneris]
MAMMQIPNAKCQASNHSQTKGRTREALQRLRGQSLRAVRSLSCSRGDFGGLRIRYRSVSLQRAFHSNEVGRVKVGSCFDQSAHKLTLQHGWRMRKQIIVVPTIKKQYHVVRAATTEDIEAEKELIEEDALERMEKTLESVKNNFNTVRTGRASPALLDRIEVEYYGSLVTLKSIAQVSTPDGSTLLIQPFDKSSLSSVEKAISKSDVGLTPSNDGNAIRLYIPPLTEERRKELLKNVSKLSEEGKIAIRNIRRDAIKSYEKLEKEKKLSTDNAKDLSVSMQKLTDDYVKKIETLLKQKEKELLTV